MSSSPGLTLQKVSLPVLRLAAEMERRIGKTILPPHPTPPMLNTQVSNFGGTVSAGAQLHEIPVLRLYFLCTGPKLYREPSAKSNKHIIQNALAHCCLAGKVNEGQKNKILDVGFSTLQLCSLLYQSHSELNTSSSLWVFCRKWRNPKPITSWCCSETQGASSGRCTPTAQRQRRSPD